MADDAARLDWAFMEVFDAPDAPPLDVTIFASVSDDAWAESRIRLHPSLRMLKLAHPIQRVREAIVRGESPLRPQPNETFVAVWRDSACYSRTAVLEASAFMLLSALAEGISLGEACASIVGDATSSAASEVGTQVAGWFQEWTANGWVSAVRFSDETTAEVSPSA